MTDIKTLDDLTIGCNSCVGQWVDASKLKKEVIKMIKDCGCANPIKNTDGEVSLICRCEGCDRMMEFFNIKESDLK